MLIAAIGLAGAGKTTALRHLERIGLGEHYYVGGIVINEVKARGLEETSASEREVREQLRRDEGMEALAVRAAPQLEAQLASGRTPLIDAICNAEERDFYHRRFGSDLILLAVAAPFAERAKRLAERPTRPISAGNLEKRDLYELETLRLDELAGAADFLIDNDADIRALHEKLNFVAEQLGQGRS